jgi:hypothetical protein
MMRLFKKEKPTLEELEQFGLFVGFCRKNIFRPGTVLFWASLSSQSIELFKNSLIS